MLNDSSKLEGSKKTNLQERFKPSKIPKYNFKGLVKKKQKERLVVKLLKLDEQRDCGLKITNGL